MAEVPGRVEHLFVTKEINPAGIYLVLLFVNGVRTPVIVDDFIPCNSDRTPCFAYSRGGELWVSLLEKAWAKCHGTYRKIEGGNPAFASIHLRGSPSRSYQIKPHQSYNQINSFWQMLRSAEMGGHSIIAASKGSSVQAPVTGQIAGLAYHVIAVHEFGEQGDEIRLVVLRNPWRLNEWNGLLSDESQLWTRELVDLFGQDSVEEEGVFVLPLMEFLGLFAQVSVSVDDDPERYHHSAIIYDFGKARAPLRMDFSFELTEAVSSEDVFTVSVAQQGNRLGKMKRKKRVFEPVAI